jgi:hypothetical protein
MTLDAWKIGAAMKKPGSPVVAPTAKKRPVPPLSASWK